MKLGQAGFVLLGLLASGASGIVSSGIVWAGASASASVQPKYGAGSVPLSRSHEYFKKADAPDYWALSPYYLSQKTGASCSSASIAMVLNGLRSKDELGSSETLVTEAYLLKKTANTDWSARVGLGEGLGGLLSLPRARGVTLELLAGFTAQALKAFGISGAQVEKVLASELGPQPEKSLARLRALLSENEKSDLDFIVLNFQQGLLTGDEGGGHVSPVAAYDAQSDRVLILDVDREWYEPYWVSTQKLLQAMNTRDPESGLTRGLLRIRRTKP